MRKTIIKIRLAMARWRFRSHPAPKFEIGDKVVVLDVASVSMIYDIHNAHEAGTIEDIFMGSDENTHQDWYYTVVFENDSPPPYNRSGADFNHWEIELCRSHRRERRLKELGIE